MGGLPCPPSPLVPSSPRGGRVSPTLRPFPHGRSPPGPPPGSRYGDLPQVPGMGTSPQVPGMGTSPQVPAWRPTLGSPRPPNAEALVTGNEIGAPCPISVLAAGGFRVCALAACPGARSRCASPSRSRPWGPLARLRRACGTSVASGFHARGFAAPMAPDVPALVAPSAATPEVAEQRRAARVVGGRARAFRQASGPVSYASDTNGVLSATPATPIGAVGGVGDRILGGSAVGGRRPGDTDGTGPATGRGIGPGDEPRDRAGDEPRAVAWGGCDWGWAADLG